MGPRVLGACVCIMAMRATAFVVDEEPDDAEEWALWVERLEHESLHEAVSESRGERDEVGLREEWSDSRGYLNRKYDLYEGRRQPVTRDNTYELR